jgi:protein-S-isoprenylcysteine O-methyltransferase Ste14
MGAIFSVLYGLVVYGFFLATLFYAIGASGYILVGIWLEERDLIAQFRERYHRYRGQVGMLVPGRRAQ